MGRRTNNIDILNARVVEFDPSRGLGSLAPFTSTSVPTSLTATATLMGLQGPGVVSLVQITDNSGTPIKLRIEIDGTDFSLSTSAVAGVYSFIGVNYATTGQTIYEHIPFRSRFVVHASKATGTVTNATFATAYRLVEL